MIRSRDPAVAVVRLLQRAFSDQGVATLQQRTEVRRFTQTPVEPGVRPVVRAQSPRGPDLSVSRSTFRTTWVRSHPLTYATLQEPHLADDWAIRGHTPDNPPPRNDWWWIPWTTADVIDFRAAREYPEGVALPLEAETAQRSRKCFPILLGLDSRSACDRVLEIMETWPTTQNNYTRHGASQPTTGKGFSSWPASSPTSRRRPSLF